MTSFTFLSPLNRSLHSLSIPSMTFLILLFACFDLVGVVDGVLQPNSLRLAYQPDLGKATIRPVFSGTVPFLRCLSWKIVDIKQDGISFCPVFMPRSVSRILKK